MCEERRRAIIELLEAERRVRVEELSRRFGVSEVTTAIDALQQAARL
jgi:DeoR/GlpR family transcriptional regulator of sugar metabolism